MFGGGSSSKSDSAAETTKAGKKSPSPDRKNDSTSPVSIKSSDQAASGEKRSGNGSPSGRQGEVEKKRRSSGVGSKASSLIASAKNSLSFSQVGRSNSEKALLDMLGGNPLPWMDIQGDRVLGVPEMLPQVAFNDMVPEEQAKWGAEMTHSSAALFATPSSHEPWAVGTPCGYIFCSDDNALPFPIQQQMAGQLGPNPKTVTLKAGHCAFLSIPDQLLEAVKTLESQLQQ